MWSNWQAAVSAGGEGLGTPLAECGRAVANQLLSAMRKEFGGHDEKK